MIPSLHIENARIVRLTATPIRNEFTTVMISLCRVCVAVSLVLRLVAVAEAQMPQGGTSLELHAGYGGGGFHPDGLVGGGITYRFRPNLDAIGLMTAVLARPTGRAVFAGTGLRLIPIPGPIRPYLTVGPLLAIRAYTQGHLGGFASLGLEAAIAGPPRDWDLFLETRRMQAGGSWTQIVGGVRATIFGD